MQKLSYVIQQILNLGTSVLIRDKQRRDTWRKGGNETIVAETGMTQPQAQECRQPQGAERSKELILSESLKGPANILNWVVCLQNWATVHSYYFKSPSFGEYINSSHRKQRQIIRGRERERARQIRQIKEFAAWMKKALPPFFILSLDSSEPSYSSSIISGWKRQKI